MFQVFKNTFLNTPLNLLSSANDYMEKYIFTTVEFIEYQIQYKRNLEMIKSKYKKDLLSMISLKEIIESIMFLNKYYILIEKKLI